MENLDRTGLQLELLLDGNLADTSGSGREAMAKGSVAFVTGRRGRCASFDGRSWIDTGFRQEELGPEFTVECWVNPADSQKPYADLFGNHVPEGQGFVVQQDGSNPNEFYAAYGVGGGQWVATESVPLAAGRWQHLALVKTRQDLRLYLNGVLVASREDPRPAATSPLPVAVGLGYTDPERCFRGLLADFRIWNRALSDFGHAGIAPEEAREVLARFPSAEPRPAAGAPVQSWTLATEDTRLTLGVTAAGELVIQELRGPAGGNWIVRPVAFDLPSEAAMAGQRRPLRWRFLGASLEEHDGRQVILRFAAADPALEAVSRWTAWPGPGPVHHRLDLFNRSGEEVRLGAQPTFDLDLKGASAVWRFHSDGGTPDPVGVYRHALAADRAGVRYLARSAPSGEFIPYVVLDAEGQQGVYLGLEWSFSRIEAVTLEPGPVPAVRVRAGMADWQVVLAPGQALAVPPGFLGAYHGDLDAAGNRLRRWLFRHRIPAVLRDDPGYPKVQWNAFGATGKAPGSWDPVEAKYYPLIDDIAPLGFEEVMIDVGWWEGQEPEADPVDWPSGMRRAADYAHARGLRFGLYWTDNLDMASPQGRAQRAARIRRLFAEYGADMWRSDCTRGPVLGASHAATQGFYEMVDALAREIPGFQWENCCGGGRIKDYGALQRCVKIFNSDTYSPLHVRQAFYDSSFALHPIQIEGHLGSTDGRFRPRGAAGMRYAFRSMSMGAPEWFLDAPNGGNGSDPWTAEEREAVRAGVATYKERLRPLVRTADLYHILPRPDGRNWDGVEYYDPASGRGVLCLFKPAEAPNTQAVRWKGLDPAATYRLTCEDGTLPPLVKTGAELMAEGIALTLGEGEQSELVFLEAVR